MNGVQRIARTAGRRLWLQELLRSCGRWLVFGSAGGCVLVGVSKFVSVPAAWWMLLGGAVAVGLGCGVFVAARVRRSALRSAQHVDHQMGLEDRLSTALMLDSGVFGTNHAGAFERVAIEDGERAAERTNAKEAVPLRWSRAWGVWPALVGVGVAIGVWAPSMNRRDAVREQAVRRERAQREEAARQVREAIEAIQTAAPALSSTQTQQDDASRQAIKELEEIERELGSGALSGAESARQAAEAMTNAAERAEQEAARVAQDAERVRDALRGTEAGDLAQRDELVRALKSGDFAAASEAARKFVGGGRSQGDPQRAEELERLARDLEEIKARKDGASNAAGAEQSQSNAGKREGGDEPTQEIAPNRGVSKDEAAPDAPVDRAAQKTGTQGDARRAPDPAGTRPDSVERLSEALREAAEEMRRGQPPTAGQETGEEVPSSGPRQESGRDATDRPGDAKAGERGAADTSQGEKKGSNEPAGESKEAQGGARPESRQEQGRSEPTQEGDKQPAAAGDPASVRDEKQRPSQGNAAAPTGKSEQPTERERERASPNEPRQRDEPGQQTRTQESREQGQKNPTPNDKIRDEAGEQQDNPQTGGTEPDAKKQGGSEVGSAQDKGHAPAPGSMPGEIPKPSERGVKRLVDELERLERAGREAGEKTQQAEDLRKRAQEMLEGMSPEQKQRVQEWAQAAARERERRGAPPMPGPKQGEQVGQREAGPSEPGERGQPRVAGETALPAGGGAGSQAGRETGRSNTAQPSTVRPTRTELVDARHAERKPGEQVAAEWLGAGTRGDATGAGTGARSVFEQAARSAERAVDERAVPRRFDRLIERYFRRLPEQVQGPARESTPAAPAKDAP